MLNDLNSLIEQKLVADVLKRKSANKNAIRALQKCLNALGFGRELNWSRFGADGDYGDSTAAAVKAFAAREGIETDGHSVSEDLLKRIVEKASQLESMPPPPDSSLPNVFKKFKRGVYTVGKHRPADFIEKNPDQLKSIGLTDSLMRIIAAVSINEGNLEAINTWDDSFLTFGMFQWTIGQGDGKGELPALIKQIKEVNPIVFNNYFGQYGLDVSDPHTDNVYGHFTHNYLLVDHASKKEKLRGDEWAQRFWEAGQDPAVQAVQVKHAASRLWTFFWKPGKAPVTYRMSDLVSSELGVALLLDNHVNRPGYVRTCLERALTQTGLQNPETWGTEEEQKLLLAYLDIRKTHGKFPMTHAGERAERMFSLQKRGKLSMERGSFVFSETLSRGMFDAGPKLPPHYRDEDYPEIQWDENLATRENVLPE
ncbi:MAG: peptidoglycan-binding protein [Saprospiraceae bacterium]